MSFPHSSRPNVGESNRDDELVGRVRHALTSAGVFALCRLDVEVISGTVHLVGQVASFHAKQLAQESARQVSGVDEIVNLLQVDAALDSVAARNLGGENRSEI